jgi:hypothetical protein
VWLHAASLPQLAPRYPPGYRQPSAAMTRALCHGENAAALHLSRGIARDAARGARAAGTLAPRAGEGAGEVARNLLRSAFEAVCEDHAIMTFHRGSPSPT